MKRGKLLDNRGRPKHFFTTKENTRIDEKDYEYDDSHDPDERYPGEWDAEESPDGGWIAYTSEVTGLTEVWLRDLEGSAPAWQVSTRGGLSPVWSADGEELFFLSADDWLMSAEVTGSDPLRTASPVRLFRAMIDVDQIDRQFDVGPDGVFLINRRGDDATEPVNVIIGLENLLEEIEQR